MYLLVETPLKAFYGFLFIFLEKYILCSGQVLWTCAGRKTLPPSMSLPVIGEIAGVTTASLGGYLYSTKTRARWAEGFHDELNGQVFDLERDGLCQVVFCSTHYAVTTSNHTILWFYDQLQNVID